MSAPYVIKSTPSPISYFTVNIQHLKHYDTAGHSGSSLPFSSSNTPLTSSLVRGRLS
eukprot:gene38427-47446_t